LLIATFWRDPLLANGHELLAWIVAGLALVAHRRCRRDRSTRARKPVAVMIVGSKRAPAEGNVECVETRPQ